MSGIHENATVLQQAMKRRRQKLGITQREMPDHGGPSRGTVAKFELGIIADDVREDTLDQIDTALEGDDGEWPPGTSRSLLDQDTETPKPEVPQSDSVDLDLVSAAVSKYVRSVTNAQRTLSSEVKQLPDVQERFDEVHESQTELMLLLTELRLDRET